MKIISEPISKVVIFEDSIVIDDQYVKAVVDVEKEIIAYDAGMHVDLEACLLENGSNQQSLWGINFLKGVEGGNWVEFDSMINIRPAQNNRSRGVEDKNIQSKILKIVNRLIT